MSQIEITVDEPTRELLETMAATWSEVQKERTAAQYKIRELWHSLALVMFLTGVVGTVTYIIWLR